MYFFNFKPLNVELIPICHLLALLGAHHILHVSRIRVNLQRSEARIMGKIGLNQSLIHIHHTPCAFLFAPRELCSQEKLFLGIKNSGGHPSPLPPSDAYAFRFAS